MQNTDRWIARYLRRLQFGLFLQRAGEWFAVFLFAFGAAVLGAKLFWPALWPGVLWLAAAGFPAAIVAWTVSQRRRFTPRESAAMLDRRLQAGGLLMTLSERHDEEWKGQLPQIEKLWRDSLPRIRPVRFARRLALPLVFAVGACFVPLRAATTEPVLRNTVGREAAQQLEETLELLQDAEVLDEQQELQLREEIEKLAEEAESTPLTHEKWETVDALREQMAMNLDAATLTVSQAQHAAEQLADASQTGDGTPLSPERAAQLEKTLREALERLGETGRVGEGDGQQGNVDRTFKNRQLALSRDPEERGQQLDQLQQFLNQEAKRLAECRGKCSACQAGMCRGGQSQAGNQPGGNKNGSPGRGGVTRGRGDAELTWGDESDSQSAKFKETVLPPGYFDEPQDQVVTVNPTAPEVDPAASISRNAMRQLDPASGKETWNRTLRPRHRSVVRRYFDSK